MELANRIRRLCVELGRGELTEIVEAAKAGQLLHRLLHALAGESPDLAAVAADLDALDDAVAKEGIDGLTTGARGYKPIIWSQSSPQYGWVCPRQQCSRAEPGPAEGGPPVCGITGAPLAWRKLT